MHEEKNVDALFLTRDWKFKQDMPARGGGSFFDHVREDGAEVDDIVDPGDGLGGALGLEAAARILRGQAAGEITLR